MSPLKPGDRAPDFRLPDQNGQEVSLSKVLEERAVVLFFYPKDDTPTCTREACAFRDAYDDFVQAGAEVIGISHDPSSAHRRFADKHGLPFTLVSDRTGSVRAAFRVPKMLFVMPGRTTFVIDQQGIIRHTFTSHRGAESHVREALAHLPRSR